MPHPHSMKRNPGRTAEPHNFIRVGKDPEKPCKCSKISEASVPSAERMDDHQRGVGVEALCFNKGAGRAV